MAIFNLRHRLAALSAWALALALAFGAALPQPAQAVGPESGYAQMHRPALISQTPILSFHAPSRMPTLDFRSQYGFDVRGCSPGSPLFACLHPDDTPPEDVCTYEKSYGFVGGAIGAGGGALFGGTIGSVAGPKGTAIGAGTGGFTGGAVGVTTGETLGRQEATLRHNADGHHPGYMSRGTGYRRMGEIFVPEIKDGKTWKCSDTK